MYKKVGFIFLGLLAAFFILTPLSNADAAELYTVQPGDSLYLIGKAYGVSVTELQQTNNISGTTIYVGQTLTIPSNNVSTTASTGIHTVKSGETLYLIGLQYGVSYQEIIRVNNLTSQIIYPGQQLRIPVNTTTDRGTVTRTSTGVSAQEQDVLARIISAEAQGESYAAQVAVGAVVLNRVASGDFPNTITDVVYQKSFGFYQFTPVENGFINNPATSSAKNAAVEALNGADPSNGALYFFESDITNQWLLSKPVTARIGAFIFAK